MPEEIMNDSMGGLPRAMTPTSDGIHVQSSICYYEGAETTSPFHYKCDYLACHFRLPRKICAAPALRCLPSAFRTFAGARSHFVLAMSLLWA